MNASAELSRIAENDPAITVGRVTLHRPDAPVPAYAAVPKDAGSATPGVVLVMHLWGVDESIRETVRRFAAAGFAAIAPDLYARLNAPDGDGVNDYTVFKPLAEQLEPGRVDEDLRAAAQWLKSRHPQGKIAVSGFCMGGAVSLRQAIDNAEVFAANGVWYGRVSGVDPAKVQMPLVASYGERDTGIPAGDVRAFREKVPAPNDVVIYPGAGHAFFDRTRPSYVASAAADSWRRTTEFFTKYLRG